MSGTAMQPAIISPVAEVTVIAMCCSTRDCHARSLQHELCTAMAHLKLVSQPERLFFSRIVGRCGLASAADIHDCCWHCHDCMFPLRSLADQAGSMFMVMVMVVSLCCTGVLPACRTIILPCHSSEVLVPEAVRQVQGIAGGVWTHAVATRGSRHTMVSRTEGSGSSVRLLLRREKAGVPPDGWPMAGGQADARFELTLACASAHRHTPLPISTSDIPMLPAQLKLGTSLVPGAAVSTVWHGPTAADVMWQSCSRSCTCDVQTYTVQGLNVMGMAAIALAGAGAGAADVADLSSMMLYQPSRAPSRCRAARPISAVPAQMGAALSGPSSPTCIISTSVGTLWTGWEKTLKLQAFMDHSENSALLEPHLCTRACS